MSANASLGLLVTTKAKEDLNFGNNAFASLINGAESNTTDDKTIAEKAVKDAKDTPSLWFINIPTSDAASIGGGELRGYMQDVMDYRCWASGVWWKNIYGSNKVPQDESKESAAKRSAFAAKIGMEHMMQTPWLGMSSDNYVSKRIECRTNEFHTELIRSVLEGFVNITPSVFRALEPILNSLSKAGDDETKTIVCERYEYIAQADAIRSYVRLISFHVSDNDKMKEVHNAKRGAKTVSCDIEYHEYEATFNRRLWLEFANDHDDSQKKAALELVQQATIDCDP